MRRKYFKILIKQLLYLLPFLFIFDWFIIKERSFFYLLKVLNLL
ncbi:MAG: hypothetical protein KatS3mg090_0573 [Patescibacteria group bacterium]|nr:MAG: hypothetical protein KatS3mg090_0573 [Patescibacteria group bacterium]